MTGVAGSPWYLNGYFTADTGTTKQVQDAWMKFLFAGPGPSVSTLPVGATATIDTDVPVVDPTNGQIVSVESSTGYSWTGSNTEQRLPPTAQALVRWRTGNFEGGREVRGRTNIPGGTESWNSASGTVETTISNLINGRAVDLINDANTVFVVWSKKNGLWWAAQSGSCWSQWAVLRSRRD